MSTTVPFLDLSATHIAMRPALDAAWTDTLATNGFVGGQAVDAFEAEFAAYTGAAHCVGVANGTDALELILAALGVGAGDEVIVPANTFIATAEAVVRVGATPVFTDVDPATALITGDAVRAALSPRTAAVMAVHLYGQPVDLDDVLAVTDAAGVPVIEDAAQAHGARWAGQPIGARGAAAGFSFYPGKNLGALGDGGAVTTNDADLAATVRTLSNHGRSSHSRYEHAMIGRNSRLDGLQARLLSVKLSHLDEHNEARRWAAGRYGEMLPASWVPIEVADRAVSVHHLYVVTCRGVDRSVTTDALTAAGVGWGLHYPVPCHRQPAFADTEQKSHPVTEDLAEVIVSLPMHPHLSDADIEQVCGALDELTAD
ncbi:MAG: DegT/DnrJ/EryC1/StrS family aminotransferase [Actinomycetota bacterium]